MRRFLIALTRNAISLFGTALTSVAAVLILILVSIEIFGESQGPYVGVLAYLILPGIFFTGLVLIPIGIVLERRRHRRARERGESSARFPVIDLNHDRTRTMVLLFLLLSLINIVILATATFKGVEVLESTEFCATSCHVMRPEWTAYQRSSHSHVKCVECHVGPGADSFVKAKFGGAWQVISATFDLYDRPIPTPVHELRPAEQICGECHGPNFYVGDKLRVITHYDDDEASTPLQTVLVLNVGGRGRDSSHGIHWHADPENQIRYRSDPSRQTVYEVELTRADGSRQRYLAPDAPEGGEWRTMDCIDCHNRPAHRFRAPEDEIDAALLAGDISTDLPFVKRQAMEVLTADYVSQVEARREIASTFQSFYRTNYPTANTAQVNHAALLLGDLYASNVFPDMNINWNSYPDHIGHERFPGCFRCHSDEHATEDGDVIAQDCDGCHSVLAMEEEAPEILDALEL